MEISGSIQEKKGRLYYSYRYTDAMGIRRQEQKALGLDADASAKKQKEKIREIEREVERRAESGLVMNPKKVRFMDWVDKWLNEFKAREIENNTLAGYKSYIKYHVEPFFGKRNVTLQQVNGLLVQEFYNHLINDKGLSVSSVKKIRAVVHGPLEWAYSLGVIVENPAKRAKLPRERNKKRAAVAYTLEELQQLFALAKDEVIFPAIYLAACFGLRRSEVLGLTWDKIDLAARTMHICQVVVCQNEIEFKDHTKTESSNRILSISDKAAKFLSDLWKKQAMEKLECESNGKEYNNNNFVCKHPDGRPLQPTFVSHKFMKIIQKSDLRYTTFHGLRHSVVTVMIHSGIDPKSVSAFAGHADLETTLGIYTDASQEWLRGTVQDLGAMLSVAT